MKAWQVVFIVVLLVLECVAQQPPAQLTKEQRKESERQRKLEEKAQREEQKRSLKLARAQAQADSLTPPTITIYGTPERIKSILVASYASVGWNIASDTPYQLTFAKDFNEQTIAGAVLLGNNAPRASRMVVSYLFAKDGNNVIVTASANKYVQNGWGAISNYIVTPQSKPDLMAELRNAKRVVEADVLAPN